MFLLGLQTDHYKPEESDNIEEHLSEQTLPESVDWRTEVRLVNSLISL